MPIWSRSDEAGLAEHLDEIDHVDQAGTQKERRANGDQEPARYVSGQKTLGGGHGSMLVRGQWRLLATGLPCGLEVVDEAVVECGQPTRGCLGSGRPYEPVEPQRDAGEGDNVEKGNCGCIEGDDVVGCDAGQAKAGCHEESTCSRLDAILAG